MNNQFANDAFGEKKNFQPSFENSCKILKCDVDSGEFKYLIHKTDEYSRMIFGSIVVNQSIDDSIALEAFKAFNIIGLAQHAGIDLNQMILNGLCLQDLIVELEKHGVNIELNSAINRISAEIINTMTSETSCPSISKESCETSVIKILMPKEIDDKENPFWHNEYMLVIN